ncbi:MAG: hypothetical protein ACKVJA_01875 [Flavobacteriales bacterium]
MIEISFCFMQIYTFAIEKSNKFKMSKDIRLKKGLNIQLTGKAEQVYSPSEVAKTCELKPTDFHGLTPKLTVKIGDKVKAGTVLFIDKYNERVKFCSPVSGEVTDIVRGEKRRILKVIITSDTDIIYEDCFSGNVVDLSRDQIIDTMCLNGVWPFIRQKPYDVIANPSDMPKSIFISAFNSEPIAIDQDILTIATLFKDGKYDVSRIIAVTGSQIKRPKYYRTIGGASIVNLLKDNLNEGKTRVISGDVFTGKKIDKNGTLGFYDYQITAIPEGDEEEFLGWMTPGLNKFSASRTFLSWLSPTKKYSLDTNLHGEERSYVMTGEYEKVLPMDIYPTQLIKSIMIEDIELMENLGIYEVSPEDFALCEFVCTSKIEVQNIIRHGLDLVRKENS